MTEFDIRPYHPADMPMLYQICLETGASGADATGTVDRDLLGHIFAAPYVTMEPELCFVLTLQGAVCGYILGARDSKAFAGWCDQNWWPVLKMAYPLRSQTDHSREAELIKTIHHGYKVSVVSDLYPAHLHIDILPVAQGQGYGPKLIGAFLDRLRELDVVGVHLGVGKANQRATVWYPRLGFFVAQESDSLTTYAMQL